MTYEQYRQVASSAYRYLKSRDKKTTAGDVSTWNPEVVWCDPYEGKLGGLDLIKKRFQGKR